MKTNVLREKIANFLCQFVSSPYPGQLPPVSRDLHNVVVPLDLSNPDDMLLVFRQIYTFVKRMIPVRFGLVPMASSPESISQLKVAHYLHETFGLSSLIKYLEEVCSVFPLHMTDL